MVFDTDRTAVDRTHREPDTSPRNDVLAGVPQLRHEHITAGQRWIYSAGFNVGPDLSETARIDCELEDLRQLADAGARVSILSHQGSHRAGTARHLDYISSYLSAELGRTVAYFPDNASEAAAHRSQGMRDGDMVLFGNTRLHAGEEQNDHELARKFSRLGTKTAVGGFSKAHRLHASNAGILQYTSGCAANSLVAEIEFLEPWSHCGTNQHTTAVLGGSKPEKTLIGLANLVGKYDLVLPGGVVLNTLLRASGYDIGSSSLGTKPDACADVAREVITTPNGTLIHLPTTVFVVPADRIDHQPAVAVDIENGVPAGHTIVDFIVEPWALDRLHRSDQALVAGPPSFAVAGHNVAAAAVVRALPENTLLVGGDTAVELPWHGPTSTGGGSALQFLVNGDSAITDTLRRVQQRLPQNPSGEP